MAAQPWYQYPISQTFGTAGEKGVDLKVPYGTPVTPLFPGRVSGVSYGPYGSEVNVTGMLQGAPVTAAYVHLDTVNVAQGQTVGPGSLLGYSGGQLSGGYHPASPKYSSGPHIELSLWPGGTTPYVGTPYNPMSFIDAVQSGQYQPQAGPQASVNGGPLALGATDTGGLLASLAALFNTQSAQQATQATSQASGGFLDYGALQNAIAGGVAGGVSAGVASGVQGGVSSGFTGAASNIGGMILHAVHVSSLIDLLWRAGLLLVGIVLLFIVAQALTGGAVRETTSAVTNSAPVKKASEVAGSVKGLGGLLK